MRKRGMAAAAAMVSLAATAVAVTATAAPALATPGWAVITNMKSGQVLTGAARGKAVTQTKLPNLVPPAQSQQWKIVHFGWAPDGHELVSFRNAYTADQFALAISGGRIDNGAPAITWVFESDHAEQIWEVHVLDNSIRPATVELINYGSDKCLAIPNGSTTAGVGAIQWPCEGLTHLEQTWKIFENYTP